jgi:hypothetical protein
MPVLLVAQQQLLEYGADVNPQGGEYGNALLAEGFADIVRQLLSRGAEHSTDVH